MKVNIALKIISGLEKGVKHSKLFVPAHISIRRKDESVYQYRDRLNLAVKEAAVDFLSLIIIKVNK